MHTVVKVEFALEAYIDQPYWTERELLIRIQKDSGMSRQKSDEKRAAAIAAHLKKLDMTIEQFRALEKKAAEPWNKDAAGLILIPRHKLAGMFVQTIGGATKSLRGAFTKDNFRSLVQIGDFTTDRREKDGVYSRFVKNDATNMRRLQEDEFIGRYLDLGSPEPVYCSGTISISDGHKPQTVKSILETGIATVGLGSCRKMGFGLGEMIAFVEQTETVPMNVSMKRAA